MSPLSLMFVLNLITGTIPRTMAIAEPQGFATARLIPPVLSRISIRKVGHEERGLSECEIWK